MARATDPLRDLLLARLAEHVGDLAQHINRKRVAADLELVRWAAQREDHIGVTPQDRREIAEAVQQLNETVFDGPDAPDPATFPQDRISLERSIAELAEAAGHWLEGADTPKRSATMLKLRIHTVEGTQEVDLADLFTIQIDADHGPLFDLVLTDDPPMIQVRAMTAGLLIRPLGRNSVELRTAD